MKKKAKLFQAFNGDAPELRNVLVQYFKTKAEDTSGTDPGSTGQRWAYREAASFLRKLVINGDEHIEDEPASTEKPLDG